MQSANRSTILDLVRGIAVVLVVLSHTGSRTILAAGGSPHGLFGVFGIREFYRVSIGGFGVAIFIVLSGLCLQLRNAGADTVPWGRFIVKRCCRIYPVYYLTVLIGIPMYYWRTGALPHFDLLDYVCTATGFYAFAGRWGGPLVGTSWFLGLIMSLYFLFPAITRPMKKHPHATVLGLFAISMLARFLIGRYAPVPIQVVVQAVRWFPLCNVFEFGLGMYLATVVNMRFWERLNGNAFLDSMAAFVGRLSFPLFLAHFPLIVVLDNLLNRGVKASWAITAYLIAALGISMALLAIDRPVSGWLRKTLRV
jgi:peptidoglycan/LPS O-acetylase OafA/YrhL